MAYQRKLGIGLGVMDLLLSHAWFVHSQGVYFNKVLAVAPVRMCRTNDQKSG